MDEAVLWFEHRFLLQNVAGMHVPFLHCTASTLSVSSNLWKKHFFTNLDSDRNDIRKLSLECAMLLLENRAFIELQKTMTPLQILLLTWADCFRFTKPWKSQCFVVFQAEHFVLQLEWFCSFGRTGRSERCSQNHFYHAYNLARCCRPFGWSKCRNEFFALYEWIFCEASSKRESSYQTVFLDLCGTKRPLCNMH